jgi:hypothetical protein
MSTVQDDHIVREALEIQEALAADGVGQDQITLHQIKLALRGQQILWDEAGMLQVARMNVEAGEHLTLVQSPQNSGDCA